MQPIIKGYDLLFQEYVTNKLPDLFDQYDLRDLERYIIDIKAQLMQQFHVEIYHVYAKVFHVNFSARLDLTYYQENDEFEAALTTKSIRKLDDIFFEAILHFVPQVTERYGNYVLCIRLTIRCRGRC